MVNAGGGGCCDCGDLSSWRPEGTCSRHRAAADDGDAQRPATDIAALFEQKQRNRMKAVVEEVARICSLAVGCTELHRATHFWPVLFLMDRCFESTGAPPTPASHTHIVFLLNDDVHSFDQVVGQLHAAIGTTSAQGNVLANAVHGPSTTRIDAMRGTRRGCWQQLRARCSSLSISAHALSFLF